MVKRIRVVALDIDGVVTDGTVRISPGRRDSKSIAFQDVDAVRRAIRSGLEVAFVTGEDNDLVDEIAGRFGVEEIVRGAKDKARALRGLARRLGQPLECFCYVGDADRDAPALAMVGLGLAPANASAAALCAAHHQLARCGGNGAVAEAIRWLLDGQTPRLHRAAPAGLAKKLIAQKLAECRELAGRQISFLSAAARMIGKAARTGRKIIIVPASALAGLGPAFAHALSPRLLPFSSPTSILVAPPAPDIPRPGPRTGASFMSPFERMIEPQDVVVGVCHSSSDAGVSRALTIAGQAGAGRIVFGPADDLQFPSSRLDLAAPRPGPPWGGAKQFFLWEILCEAIGADRGGS